MNRQHLTGGVKTLLHATGLVHAARLTGPKDGLVRILAYHSVSPPNSYCTNTIRVSPELFNSQMSYLSKYYSVISLDRAIDYMQNNRALPPRAVAITFDDGYLDNHQYALPILKKHGATATFFVVSSVVKDRSAFWVAWLQKTLSNSTNNNVLWDRFGGATRRKNVQHLIDMISVQINSGSRDQRNALLNEVADLLGCQPWGECAPSEMMSLQQVRDLSEQGMCIGSHTKTHAIASSLADGELEDELQGSRSDLEEALQQNIDHLAFPNGPGVVNCNDRTADFASRAGYKSAATSRRGTINLDSNRYLLERHSIHQVMGTGAFAYKLEEHRFPYLALAGGG